MRILIVDDSSPKIGKVINHVVGKCEINREDIHVAQSAQTARAILRKETFDLMILDLALPLRPENDPSLSTSMELLKELVERDIYRKPKQIVGLTAYEDLKEVADPHFKERLWTIILYDETSDDWLVSIEQCIRYICDAFNQAQLPSYQCDLCIITALQSPEMDAIHKLPWNWEPVSPLDDVTFIRKGGFSSGGSNFSTISAVAPRMGMVAAALLTAKIIEKCKPRFIVMTGICAGVTGKVNMGDVVLFDPSWDFQSGKRTIDKGSAQFAIAPHQIPVAAFVVSRMERLKLDHGLWANIRSAWPSPPTSALKLVIGPGASGSAVLADGEVIHDIKVQHRNLLAVEMEAYGLYAASFGAGSPRPTAFAIKSVCDFADAKKGEEMRTYAAYTSASALQAFFEANMADIAQLAGT